MRRSALRSVAILCAGAAWLAVAAAGLGKLASYATAAQETPPAPREWPHESSIVRPEGMACAIVFLHPRCPCSAATLGELNRVLARAPRDVRVIAAFFAPSGEDAGWAHTRLRSQAETIPGVQIVEDRDGREAALFGAITSGHVVAYAPDGSLMFRGGITSSRGHEGDNVGAARLLAALSGQVEDAAAPPVYGCEMTRAECPRCQPGEAP